LYSVKTAVYTGAANYYNNMKKLGQLAAVSACQQ
jgi:hypothetical protein